MYNEEIVQLSGGMNDYIGKLDQTDHPRGPGWYRIKDPCLVFVREHPTEKKLQRIVTNMAGPAGSRSFRKFVDVYIPDCAPMEIKVLDKSGPLHKFYREEIDRKKGLIIVPDQGIAMQ